MGELERMSKGMNERILASMIESMARRVLNDAEQEWR